MICDEGTGDLETGNVGAAAQVLHQSGVVAHATEGVWGFACDPHSGDAVARILQIKGRAQAKGLLLIAASGEAFASELDAHPQKEQLCSQIEASWPGPHTWVLPNIRFASRITGEHATVACRVPGHTQARALCTAFGGPLVSTSANRAGEEPALTEQEVRAKFASEVDYVLSGEVNTPGQASTIYDLQGNVLRGRKVVGQ